jgi:hypothetical protein
MPKRRLGADAPHEDAATHVPTAKPTAPEAIAASAAAVAATVVATAAAAAPGVQELLTCPVCYEVMFPPVKQCARGHPLCHRCCAKLVDMSAPSGVAKCPLCCVRLGASLAAVPRALVLEQLAATHVVTCPEVGGVRGSERAHS